MVAGEPQVQHDAVDLLDAQCAEHLGQVAEVGVDRLDRELGQARACAGHGGRVAVQGDDQAVMAHLPRQGPAVAAPAQGAVYQDALLARGASHCTTSSNNTGTWTDVDSAIKVQSGETERKQGNERNAAGRLYPETPAVFQSGVFEEQKETSLAKPQAARHAP